MFSSGVRCAPSPDAYIGIFHFQFLRHYPASFSGIDDSIRTTAPSFLGVGKEKRGFAIEQRDLAEILDEVSYIYDLALISIFAGTCLAIFVMTYLAVIRARPRISSADLWTTQWFVLCSAIHLILEGSYAYSFRTMGSRTDLLGQLWKEYSLSDSRYLSPDAFVLCMETITAVCWGPLSLITAVCIVRDHVLRHPLQIVVSLGQLYGDVLYYATSWFGHEVFGVAYSRPERYYFWGYFVFCNAFWIVVPLVLLYRSFKATAGAFAVQQRPLVEKNGAKKTL
ncbi:EXPERA domain-containing protein [Aspergillus thermomutatus]|uniref:EXPERA domain-containing protein n=1 Tax=Aspergillus thermomutatus TaxID=41047 RepID=A0A397HR86_ASPTH|nr:uncharacterized protein CDV56_108982 [Aspergillus thermomutatus]RHZ65685.1 hypothetical protein CDV56_108982 [Aspergillus thermomutatus]